MPTARKLQLIPLTTSFYYQRARLSSIIATLPRWWCKLLFNLNWIISLPIPMVSWINRWEAAVVVVVRRSLVSYWCCCCFFSHSAYFALLLPPLHRLFHFFFFFLFSWIELETSKLPNLQTLLNVETGNRQQRRRIKQNRWQHTHF